MLFEVKDRTRINENFNGLKAGQLVEIVKVNELKQEYQIIDVQNYHRHYVKESQLEKELA
jgi:hypothetical protein